MFRSMLAALLATGVLGAACPVQATDYPAKQIDVVIPYSTGNGLDLLGREFSHLLEKELGVPLVVLNRDGAAGVIGTAAAARAPADGYTLLFHANPPFVTSALASANPPYDPRSSFVPVAQVGSGPLVLVTSAKSPFTDFAGMKAYVQAHPDKANYASAGVGSPGHIYGELLNRSLGANIQGIPYKATGQALIDVVSGQVLLSLVSVTAALPYLADDRLRALAVGSARRLEAFPEVPTLSESLGMNDFQAQVWYAFFAPAGTPRDRVETLARAIERVAATPRIQEFMGRMNMVAHVRDGRELADILTEDVNVADSLLEATRLTKH